MRILFMGTPDFAVSSLKALIKANYEIVGVFTQPDKPKGRGNKMQFSPVKELALESGLEVFQPKTLKDEEVQNSIKELNPDMIIVAAYGKLLPKAVLDIPKYGCINVHGSLLPKYRGAAPIQWSVLNGDKITGITTMYMGVGLDTGDMLLKREVKIGEDETSGELFDRLMVVGADLLLETIPLVERGEIVPEPQDETEATFAPMINKEMSLIDWNAPAENIKYLIRGLNPWPCAATIFCGKRMKIFSAQIINASGEPGVANNNNGKLMVFCGKDALILKDIQLENGKRMSGESFLLGHPIAEKIILGE